MHNKGTTRVSLGVVGVGVDFCWGNSEGPSFSRILPFLRCHLCIFAWSLGTMAHAMQRRSMPVQSAAASRTPCVPSCSFNRSAAAVQHLPAAARHAACMQRACSHQRTGHGAVVKAMFAGGVLHDTFCKHIMQKAEYQSISDDRWCAGAAGCYLLLSS